MSIVSKALEDFLKSEAVQNSPYSAVVDGFGKIKSAFTGPPRFTPEQMRGLTAPGLTRYPAATNQGNSLNGIQMGRYGPTDWNPTANPVLNRPVNNGRSNLADLNYAAEKTRVAQLTEQDPLFKKYQVADLTKQYNAAKAAKNFDEADRIGMQIWAQTNPTLAASVQANQTGYGAIQSAPGMGMSSLMQTTFNPAAAQPGATTPAVNYATAPSLMQARAGLQSDFNPTIDSAGIVHNPYGVELDPTLLPSKISQLELQALRQAYNQRLK